MKIGIDATCWANERGYGRFTRELVSAMVSEHPDHEFVCFLDSLSAQSFELEGKQVHRIVVRQSAPPTLAASSGSRRSILDMLRLSWAVGRARLDVFFSPSVYGFFPVPPGLPAVVTVHDAIAERFPAMTLPTWKDRWSWNAKVRLALMQSRIVLTVSPYAAREIAKYHRIPMERMRVTLEGVANAYRPADSEADIRAAADRARLPSGARWLMYVGGFGPHKHVDVIVKAHADVVDRQKQRGERPVMLVLVGHCHDGFHTDVSGIRAVVKQCGTEHLVRWVGFLPDAEVRHLHAGALALLLVSASEGFGLPAVEAASCGTPVIATTESPLPELLEGGGLFVQPGDQPALAAAIDQLATDDQGRRAMGARAQQRASELSWSRAGRIALAALEEAANMAEKLESKAHART
jgi:glycosyltransferase involved in cell wall biosynthesis